MGISSLPRPEEGHQEPKEKTCCMNSSIPDTLLAWAITCLPGKAGLYYNTD